MANKIAISNLNASTIDIINVIRQNASYEYQSKVPKVTKSTEIPKVGEVIYGTPAFANEFLNALLNRIALVKVKSAIFNNPYVGLKKGYLEFGETIEDIFVQIADVVEFDADKASAREFKRTFPKVESAFYAMNWRVMYPVTIQDKDLYTAFQSLDGVQNLIAKIVDSIYTAAEYDEFLLFKYLIIKAVATGKMYPIKVGDGTDLKVDAVEFRGTSNLLPFMSSTYNEAGVLTTTPKDRQQIFMDAHYNAQFDVNVLSSAFNMDKADFMGRLHLIDSFTTFDNKRWEIIRENCDGIEAVTDAELALMQGVKAVIVDEEWFQVYDNKTVFTETYVASGLYWNYFLHIWKTLAHSPFANAIVFATASGSLPSYSAELTGTVETVTSTDDALMLAVSIADGDASLEPRSYKFQQTEDLTEEGVAVQKYGAFIVPKKTTPISEDVVIGVGNQTFVSSSKVTFASLDVGSTITFQQSSSESSSTSQSSSESESESDATSESQGNG